MLFRRVPEGTGWVLDGFPTTYNQAKTLEKALSGFDAAAKDGKGRLDKGKQKKSILAPDPRPPPIPADPASGIDVVILFDVTDNLCLKRAAGRTSKQFLLTRAGKSHYCPDKCFRRTSGHFEYSCFYCFHYTIWYAGSVKILRILVPCWLEMYITTGFIPSHSWQVIVISLTQRF